MSATAGLAGCSGGDDTDTEDEEPTAEPTETEDQSNTNNDESTGDDPEDNTGNSGTETIADKTYTVPEGAYRGRTFSLNRTATVEWEGIVRSGPAVDFILMQQSEIEAYENKERFRYGSEGSELNTTNGAASTTLQSGDYALIIDNSEISEATPPSNGQNDVAEVEITIVVS